MVGSRVGLKDVEVQNMEEWSEDCMTLGRRPSPTTSRPKERVFKTLALKTKNGAWN